MRFWKKFAKSLYWRNYNNGCHFFQEWFSLIFPGFPDVVSECGILCGSNTRLNILFPLVPFCNEHTTATRVQHRTSRDGRNQSEYIVTKKLQQQQIHLKLLPHICPLFSSICPLFSRYHLDRSFASAIPASSMLACEYILGHFFVRSSFLLRYTHACCCSASIVERPLAHNSRQQLKVCHANGSRTLIRRFPGLMRIILRFIS